MARIEGFRATPPSSLKYGPDDKNRYKDGKKVFKYFH